MRKVQLGAAESDIPGHRPVIPTVTLAQAPQAWKPESHTHAPSPSQPMGRGRSAWLTLVPSPHGELGTKAPSPDPCSDALTASWSFENKLSCTQSPGHGTSVHLSPVCKGETDPSPELHKDIFGILLLLK